MYKAYADEPANTGIASNPVLIIPNAKIIFAIPFGLENLFTYVCNIGKD